MLRWMTPEYENIAASTVTITSAIAYANAEAYAVDVDDICLMSRSGGSGRNR